MTLASKCAALAFGLSSAALVHAQPVESQRSGFYAGATLTYLTYKEDGIPSANPIALGFKVGKQFHPNFAVEGRLGFGIADDEVDVSGISVKLEADSYYGVYAKGMLPLSQAASVYGLLGYTHTKLTASVGGFSTSDSESDVSFGVGAEFGVSPAASLSVEWARLVKGDGYKVDGLSLAVSFKF